MLLFIVAAWQAIGKGERVCHVKAHGENTPLSCVLSFPSYSLPFLPPSIKALLLYPLKVNINCTGRVCVVHMWKEHSFIFISELSCKIDHGAFCQGDFPLLCVSRITVQFSVNYFFSEQVFSQHFCMTKK